MINLSAALFIDDIDQKETNISKQNFLCYVSVCLLVLVLSFYVTGTVHNNKNSCKYARVRQKVIFYQWLESWSVLQKCNHIFK